MQVRHEKENKRKSLQKKGQKLLAFVLCLGMLLGAVDTTVFAANSGSDTGIATAAVTADDKVADPSTMNGWTKYFSADSTEYAGAVWSDKSVFDSLTPANDKSQTDEDIQELIDAGVTMVDENSNFLVALSGLASTKEIVGYSTIPTDTILVLDVSQSMDNSKSVPDMIRATNSAIQELLSLNKNNRVGVVLYSGNHNFGRSDTDTGTVLLPLGRYVANSDGRFLWYGTKIYNESDGNGTFVTIASGVENENPNKDVRVTSKTTQGGTYIQNGLYKAWETFEEVEDTVVTTDGDNVQEGTKRMPILVLMSDGAPTTGTASYNNVGTSHVGNGGRSSAGLGFMTQLTAAWVREKIEAHYDNDMKFYTLGLELSREDAGKKNIAESVLDPSNSMRDIDNIWRDILNDGTATFSSPNGTGNTSNNGDQNVTVRLSADGVTFDADSQNYVDRFFEADSNAELNAAFDDIVEEIKVQSAYYPTLVTDGEHNLDGYLSFDDELGVFMEVKNITGLVLGDTLFSGKTLAQMMATTDVFGNRDKYTELGWELVETVSERIGVSPTDAISLLQTAWADKQLYYERGVNGVESYSNYIGWYENDAGEYVGNWLQAHTEADVAAMVTAGAKYITKSYGFYGPTDEDSSIAGSNMMHVVVKVRTDIATGNQSVIFEVPASLIPMVTYKVELDTDSIETAEDITLTMDPEDPIRLVYEVGLRSDINELNIDEVYAELQANHVQGLHMHKNTDGTYAFYSNLWGSGKDIGSLDPSEHQTTEAWFEPSVENERYYYTANSTILVPEGSGYKPYKGEDKPTGAGYYYARTYFVVENGEARQEIKYVPVAEATLSAHATKAEDGSWYIPKGRIYRELTRFETQGAKSTNPTGTLGYYMYPVLYMPSTDAQNANYNIYKYHGNNGLLTLKPATGIKLTKLVDATITDLAKEYTFTIQLEDTSVNGDYTLTKADGSAATITFAAGKATVTLKANETVYITDLPDGNYTITEIEGSDYKVKSVTVDSILGSGTIAADTIDEYDLDDVIFTNTKKAEGNLIVRKTVTHELPTTPDSFAEKEFTAVIELKDAADVPLAEKTYSDGTGGTVATDENGKATVKLKNNGSITLQGLPEGATYTVTETNLPAGFTLQTAPANLTGSITANEEKIVTLVNDYQPGGVPADGSIKVVMTKTVEGREWQSGDSFTFHIEKMNADGSWTQIGESQTVDYKDYEERNTTLTFDVGQLTTIGVHTYQIVEENANSIPGITSDSAHSFTINVTDTDGNGYLEIASNGVSGTDVTYNASSNTVEMEFVNTYATEGTATINIPIHKLMNNETGVVIPLNDYTFELYKTDSTYELADDAVVYKEVHTNTAGEAEFHLSFTGDDFNALNKAENDNNDTVTLYYVLKEKAGSVIGIDYSKETYNVKIVLEKENAVVQEQSTTITKAGSSEPTTNVSITNTFTLKGKTTLDFPVEPKKSLTGRTEGLEDEEFAFSLYETGANFVVGSEAIASASNDATGKVDFGQITYSKVGTYYYVITEDHAGETIDGVAISTETYYVTVVIGTDNNEDLVVKSTTIVKPGSGVVSEDQVVFNNTYSAEPASIVLKGTKTLSTDKVFKNLEHGMFTFNLIENDVVIDTAVNLATPLNNNTAEFIFDEITYDTVGTHTYTIKESIPEEADRIAGIEYDYTEYSVVVEVTDDGKGNLVATPTVNGDISATISFENEYKADPIEHLKLNGTKTLNGDRESGLEAGEFTFQLYAADADFNQGELVDIAVNAANGSVEFDLGKFDEVDTYYYIIKEDLSNKQYNVYYDEAEYHVTVETYDIGGKLASRITYEKNGISSSNAAFTNVYAKPQPAEFALELKKTLKDRALEGDDFTFELYETDATYSITGKTTIQTKKNDKDGNVVFDTINLDAEKTYYYVLKENIPDNTEGVTYDTTQYQIKVVVEDRGEGYLRETIYIVKEGEADTDVTANHQNGTLEEVIKFANEYNADPTTITFGGTKSLSDKNLSAGDFTFELYETDSAYNTTGLTALQSKNNAADGKYAFDALTLSGKKTHYYVIKEKAGSDNKVTYDDTVYQIKVDVKDNGKGSYVYDVTYGNVTITEAAAESILDFNFENAYNPDDAVLNISGTKALEGRTMIDGEFEFALYETGSNYKVSDDAKQVKANKDGKVTFDSLVFDKEGTFYYVVEEVVPAEKEGVDYDKASYKIKVVVENNDEGKLLIDVTCGSDKYADKELVELKNVDFKNTYTSKLPDGIALGLAGQKYMTGDRTTVEAKEFEFVLYEVTVDKDGKETVTELDSAKNDKTGAFEFEPIDDYTEAGVYSYRITESAADAVGMTYDDSVYNVSVTVEDDGKGNLIIKEPVYTVNGKVVKELAFTNTYDEPDPINVTFDITKLLENKTDTVMGLKDFEFKLTTGLFGSTVTTAKTDANGKAAITMTYTVDDIGETFDYKISEVNTGIGGMKYDKDKVKVSVSITEENGVLKATVTQDGKAVNAVKAQFTNEYVGVPVTGDMADPVLWTSVIVVALSAVALMVYFRRRRA